MARPADVMRRCLTFAQSAIGWTILLFVFVVSLAGRLLLPLRVGPYDAVAPISIAGDVTLVCGVLTILFAPNWKARFGFAVGVLSISYLSVWVAAERFHCYLPYRGHPVCERLYGVHLLVLFSLALGLMVFLYLAIDRQIGQRRA